MSHKATAFTGWPLIWPWCIVRMKLCLSIYGTDCVVQKVKDLYKSLLWLQHLLFDRCTCKWLEGCLRAGLSGRTFTPPDGFEMGGCKRKKKHQKAFQKKTLWVIIKPVFTGSGAERVNRSQQQWFDLGIKHWLCRNPHRILKQTLLDKLNSEREHLLELFGFSAVQSWCAK